MEELARLKEIDIRTVNRDELIDITRLPKDKTDCGDREMRMKKFIQNVRNPYFYEEGDIIEK